MTRRARRSGSRALFVLGVTVAGVAWLWSQWWGRALLISAVTAATLAGVVYLARAPQRRRARLFRLSTMQGLLELSPAEFEVEVAALLESSGFGAVAVSGGAGDLQADIVAIDPQGLHTIVQCKRYLPDRTVGSPVIQSFIGMARVHHECERALFVTTGSFTTPAQRLADEHDIELVDGDELVEWFAQRAGLARATG